MGAIAPIVVSPIAATDTGFPIIIGGSATDPAPTTFSPEGFTQNGVAKWVDRSGGIPLLYPSFTLSVRPPTRQSQIARVTAKLVLPTADITSPSTATGIQPAPSKAYDITVNLEALLPNRCTLAERRTALSLMLSFLAKTIRANDGDPEVATGSPMVGAFENLEQPY